MLRSFTFLGVCALALSSALLVADPVQARGGHGGGGHHGGGHHGGGHHHSHAHHGNHHGFNHNHHYAGNHGWRNGYGRGYGRGGWYGGYYGYGGPAWGGYWGTPGYYYSGTPAYYYGGNTVTRNATVARPPASQALVNVQVPSEATVWFNGEATKQTGSNREFSTSGLTPGQSYQYTVRARWTDNGQVVDRTRNITVHGGERRRIEF